MKDVYKFLNSLNIDKEDTLIIGVSFGPDSMFLLDLLKNKYKDNKIICAHVHHNHRRESDEEAIELEKYCNSNNIIFEFYKIDKYTDNKFTEEEARHKRYSFFKKLMDKYNSKYLFTAHHGDDLSETILMRLVRGSNLNGYKGISLISRRDSYSIIRPLLFLDKEYIEKYCDENNIPYAVDKSNASDLYTRNRYRNNILKYLKKENEDVHLKFLQFSKELEEYDYYIRKIIDDKYDTIVIDNIINVDSLRIEEKLIQRKIIERYLFNNYKDDIKLINNNILDSILYLINSSKPNMTLNMPLNKNLIKSYNKIYFDKYNEYNSYSFELKSKIKIPLGVISIVSEIDNTSNYMTKLDSSEIKLPLIVRSRKTGDKIEVLNSGTKKVKDIFINSKIDRGKRDLYPVVTDSNGNILWLPGIKKSKYDKSKSGNYDIILKYSEKGK